MELPAPVWRYPPGRRGAALRAESDGRVIDADSGVEAARADRDEVRRLHKQERRALLVSAYGGEQARRVQFGMGTINPYGQAQDARTRAAPIRAEADELRELSLNEAPRRIDSNHAELESAWQQVARRAQQLGSFARGPRPRPSP